MHILKKIIPGVLCSVLAAVAHAQQVRKGGTVPQEAESSSYKLRAGDSVEIRVFKHDELSVRGPIGADGTVALTFLDSITIAGLTPSQARARIEAMYADGWFKKPQVAVNVVEYARATITVTGQVNRPGTFALSRNRSMTLLEAIGTAGHFKNTANQKRVLLKRGGKTYEVNVKNILKNPQTDVTLRDGDIIWVKEAIL